MQTDSNARVVTLPSNWLLKEALETDLKTMAGMAR
jgi:hypothetical protein